MKEKNINKKGLLKILISLILIISIILLAQFAWAKYITFIGGNSKADIAKWSLVVNGNTNKSFTIKLAETRSGTQEAEVRSGYIGPGTSGKFEIEVDATDSEVSLKYSINMEVDYNDNNAFPKNLIFYSDQEMKNAIYHTDNSIILNGYIAQNAENKKIPHTIYWKWDFETGQTQADKDKNDEADSYWIGQNISIPITVVGEQVNQNSTENQYTATFDTNGGLIEGYGNAKNITKTVIYGEPYGTLLNPSKDGYEFEGWYVNENIISTNPSDWYNGALYLSGTESSDSKRLCLKDYLRVMPAQKYSFATTIDSSICIRMIHFYDNNKNFISYLQRTISGSYTNNITFSTPENCAYIKISLIYSDERIITPADITQARPYLKMTNVIGSSIVTQKSNHTLLAIWNGRNISVNPIEWCNVALSINGTESVSHERICPINFVLASPNQNYIITTDSDSLIRVRIIHFYDKYKNFISYVQYEGGGQYPSSMTFTTPENCAYIKVSLMYTDERTITPDDVIQANPYLAKN